MKKVLSWVLVLALVLGSFATSFAGDTASSKDFKDAAKIQCVEAVDVMVATGVIKGYPDGTFQPEKTVTRAEMAKMIATIKNGGEDIGDTYAGSCTFADSANHWAAGYIGYCAAKGIIAGRSADVFDPDATVTGTEAAKMALVALGYKAEAEGLTGADWAANTLDLAKENDLFEDCTSDFAPGKDLSRDNAAQILFNALNAEMVKYEGGTTVTIGDAQVVVDADCYGTGETLGEDAFDGDLVKEVVRDDFGAPATDWTYDDDEIGTYADEADYTFVVDDDESLMAAIEEYDEDLADDFDKAPGKKGAKRISAEFKNGQPCSLVEVELGDVVELYESDKVDGVTLYDAVVKHYHAYQITEVDTDVKTKDADDGVYAYVEIDGLGTYNDDDIVGFNKETYVEDAVIQVASSDGDILDSYSAIKVRGEVSKIYKDGFMADGTRYEYTGCYTELDGKTVAVEKEYDFFLTNGYVNGSLFVEDNSTTYYGVLVDIGQKTAEFAGDNKVLVKIFTADGEEVVYGVDDDYTVNVAKDNLIAYTLNDDEEVDSIVEAEGFFEDKEMKTGGTVAGKTVADDVAVFAYDYDEEEYILYGYEDIENADPFTADYIMDDDEMVAMYLYDTLESSDDTFAFITDYEASKVKKGYEFEITAIVDGKEETYTTVVIENEEMAADCAGALEALSDNRPVILVFDADGLVKDFYDAELEVVEELADDLNADGAVMHGMVATKSGTSINVGTEDNKNFQSIAGATVIYVNEDGDFELATASKIKKNTMVILVQTEEDASAWNIVIVCDENSDVSKVSPVPVGPVPVEPGPVPEGPVPKPYL